MKKLKEAEHYTLFEGGKEYEKEKITQNVVGRST